MALYTILFALSIFLIVLLIAIIKEMFFHWKVEHAIESKPRPILVDRPAVSLIIYTDKCVIRRKIFSGEVNIYDIISKSDISLPKTDEETLTSSI